MLCVTQPMTYVIFQGETQKQGADEAKAGLLQLQRLRICLIF